MARKGVSRSSVYRREGSAWLIEIRLRELRQLFHHLDPAPFREKDLDPAAETYIDDAMREIGTRQTVKLLVYLPEAACSTEEARTLPDAVAHYFSYRAAQTRVELHRLLRRALANLAVGLAFLGLCLWLRKALAAGSGAEVLGEGLLIIGWVALWRPVEMFLYDWWPVLRRVWRFEAIARMPIEIRGAAATGPPLA
jgi:hypothetical protein